MVARGKVRYVGEPVAAVAAIDAETAERAAAAIEVDYEPLPAVLVDRRRAGRRCADPARGVRELREGHRRRRPRQRRLRKLGHRRRRRARLRRLRRDRRGQVGNPGPASRLPRDQRLPRRRRCQRPHHAACDLPVGAPPAAARRRGDRRADVAHPRDRDPGRRRLRRQAPVQHPLDRRLARPGGAAAGQAGAVADPGLRGPALPPPGAHLDAHRRPPRRHDPGTRRADRHRRRRLRRREPAGAGVRAADVARPVPDRQRSRQRPGGLHQQAALRIVPRLRQPPGQLRRGIADRRARAAARHRSGRAASAERDAARRHRVRRPAGAIVRARGSA